MVLLPHKNTAFNKIFMQSNKKYFFNDEEILNFPANKLFQIVIDVEKYPNFIPWCSAVNIKEQNDNFIIADLLVNFKGLKGQYTSRITFLPPTNIEEGWIKVEAIKGMFKHLHNSWNFQPIGIQTLVKFNLNFEFQSRIIQSIFNLVYKNIQKKIITAFKQRAGNITT